MRERGVAAGRGVWLEWRRKKGFYFSYPCPYLLREAQDGLQRAQRALSDYDDAEAQTLSQTLKTWLDELQQALGIQVHGDAVDA